MLYRLGFKEAVEGGMLCDYKVIIAGVSTAARVDAAGLRAHTARVGGKEVPALVAAQLQSLRLAVERMEKDERRRVAAGKEGATKPKIFTFHSSNDAAKQFMELVNSELCGAPLHACAWHVFGSHKGATQPVDVRNQQLVKFVNWEHVAVVCSCKALQEGVDVPRVNAVAFIDPKKSHVDIAQAIGRALRMAPGKDMAYVIIPLLLDEADCGVLLDRRTALLRARSPGDAPSADAAEADEAMQDAESGEAMDEDSGDAASAGSESAEPAKAKRAKRKRAGDAEERGPPACFGTLLEVLSGIMQCDERLEARVDDLRAALASHNSQRIRDAEKALEERILLVGDAALGGSVPLADVRSAVFIMIQDWLADAWAERYGQLLAIVDAGGDPNVSNHSKDDTTLGRWLYTQRSVFRAGKLLPERLAKLLTVPKLRGFAAAAAMAQPPRTDFDERIMQLQAWWLLARTRTYQQTARSTIDSVAG